jgi:hypothetical protein
MCSTERQRWNDHSFHASKFAVFGPRSRLHSILKELQKPGNLYGESEFGWEPHEQPAYLSEAKKYEKLSQTYPIEYVTLQEYMEKYGRNPEKTIYLNMDSWQKLLPWGIGGDQLRVMDRKVEAILLAAERFDAIASSLGGKTKTQNLQAAWKDLLTAQSHDVSLCEFSRWQSDRMAPLDRSEDFHNFTWGAIGFNHLSAAQNQSQSILDSSVGEIAKRINTQSSKPTTQFVTVFNPSAWDRSEVIVTGRIYPKNQKAKNVVIKDEAGRFVPHQVVKSERDTNGNLQVASLAFLAEKTPSVGYASYSVEFTNETPEELPTDLKINQETLELENEYLKIRWCLHGAIASLVDKKPAATCWMARSVLSQSSGKTQSGLPQGAFSFTAVPCDAMKIPAVFDSSQSEAKLVLNQGQPEPSAIDYWKASMPSSIRWIEKGPVRATVKASHYWPLLKFETYVFSLSHACGSCKPCLGGNFRRMP